MRAAVLYEYGTPLRIEELELEGPKAREVLIRMAASGVCRSDWHTVRGVHPHPLPIVLGHEGAAIALEHVNEALDRFEAGEETRSVIVFG